MTNETEMLLQEYLATMESAEAGALVFVLVTYFFALLFSLAVYVCMSLSMYTIAKRRQIRHPWLAWIPVGNLWMMGAISDDYHRVARRTVKNKRKWLLTLYLVAIALMIVMMIGAVMVVTAKAAFLIPPTEGVALMFVSMLLMMAAATWMSVLQYIALYDIYCSCQRQNAVLYLVLSIFVNITMPIFMLVCKNHDEADYIVGRQAQLPD